MKQHHKRILAMLGLFMIVTGLSVVFYFSIVEIIEISALTSTVTLKTKSLSFDGFQSTLLSLSIIFTALLVFISYFIKNKIFDILLPLIGASIIFVYIFCQDAIADQYVYYATGNTNYECCKAEDIIAYRTIDKNYLYAVNGFSCEEIN